VSNVILDRSTDGGATWGADTSIYTTNVAAFNDVPGGQYVIPAAPTRGMGAFLSIDIDRSGGANDGNIYVTVLDQGDLDGVPDPQGTADHDNTDVFLLRSTDNGATFASVRVNDDAGVASQFLPWVDVDQTNGAVGVAWHDARDDAGNVRVRTYYAESRDGGATFRGNTAVSAGQSDQSGADFFDYGEYLGLDLHDGEAFISWADNSNSQGDNPGGQFGDNDAHFARVRLQLVDQLTIAQANDTNVIGEVHTVTATATELGNAVAGAQVTFSVAGANNLTRTVFTDANGVATLTYTGVLEGLDQISAVVEGTLASTPPFLVKTWLAASVVTGTVFFDNFTVNNVQDLPEIGIPQVTIQLVGVDFRGQQVNRTALTDANGIFTFATVAPGTYSVIQVQPGAYIDGFVTAGAAGGNIIGSNAVEGFVLGAGTLAGGYNFSELGLRAEFVSKRQFLTGAAPLFPGTVDGRSAPPPAPIETEDPTPVPADPTERGTPVRRLNQRGNALAASVNYLHPSVTVTPPGPAPTRTAPPPGGIVVIDPAPETPSDDADLENPPTDVVTIDPAPSDGETPVTIEVPAEEPVLVDVGATEGSAGDSTGDLTLDSDLNADSLAVV
jgi:hypothetical protein